MVVERPAIGRAPLLPWLQDYDPNRQPKFTHSCYDGLDFLLKEILCRCHQLPSLVVNLCEKLEPDSGILPNGIFNQRLCLHRAVQTQKKHRDSRESRCPSGQERRSLPAPHVESRLSPRGKYIQHHVFWIGRDSVEAQPRIKSVRERVFENEILKPV